ncbi:MAG TPA: hypothetical protein ENH12_02845 [Proteobacteria bacterium]|nr:hypothetical protein [Pseudomonadota bacterium]
MSRYILANWRSVGFTNRRSGDRAVRFILFALVAMTACVNVSSASDSVSSSPARTDIRVVDQAIRKYPILSRYGLKGVVSLGAQPYKLEFWDLEDPGSAQEPRPKEIPLGSIGVQIFSEKVRPIDVLADVVSHYLRFHDPKIKAYYQEFVDSLTFAQKERLKVDYQWSRENEGTTEPYETWVKRVRLPAYFRGYTFNQWPGSFTQKVFTPAQIDLFDQVRKYVGVE